MLSKAREGGLLLVRGILAAGWVVLIVSLFWDPVTPELTRADSPSPFHLQDKPVTVQGQALVQEPYAMGNRIFWTMLIPLLPLFFMVAGHEAWRRICPLSLFSQLPRYLGMQRKRPVLDRRSGKITRQLALVAKDDWARRNVWYVQFGLLFLGLNARLLVINADRTALALFLIGIIVCAIAVGALYGGKTWCNYICPVAVVQKIYTEPRGLLESAPHVERPPVSQSMCRAPAKGGDRSICVGCTPSCPDIDLEKSHWDTIADPSRRNVYYMFFGLVLGFYTFYFVYSGNWDYYFSGAWTHERDQLATLWSPGIYFEGKALPIPKIVAAPLVTGLFCALALALGRLLESLYRRVRARVGRPLREPELLAQCMAVSAYLTINAFYLFGGRPNLNLLPGPALRAVDIAIIALSTLWLVRAMQRTPTRYRREGLASSLLEQLRALKLDISRFLDDRKLDELQPDEVYVLAKTLPQFSREQKLAAYRNILEDALQRGRTNSAASLEMLREVRTELGVDDDEHRRFMEDLGASADAVLDSGQTQSYESWLRISNYRHAVELAVIGHLEKGQRLAAVLERADVQSAVAGNREFYRITQAEHDAVLGQITGGGGMIFERAKLLLEPICRLASLRLGLAALMPRNDDAAALAKLLSKVLRARLVSLCTREFSALLALGDTPEARWLAGNLSHILGTDLDAALAERVDASAEVTWEQSLSQEIVMALKGAPMTAAIPESLSAAISYHKVVDECIALNANLATLSRDADPHVQALAVTALGFVDAGMARQVARELDESNRQPHWLLREALDPILGRASSGSDRSHFGPMTITVAAANATPQTYVIDKPCATIGRDPSNDVVIPHASMSPLHFALALTADGVELRRDEAADETYVDGARVKRPALQLRNGARIGLQPDAGGLAILVSWPPPDGSRYGTQVQATITKMIWLSSVRVFEELDLDGLADIAGTAEVRTYSRGAWLCRVGEPSSDAFMLQSGQVEIFTSTCDEQRVNLLGAGAILGEIGVITGRPRAASARVCSASARVLAINGERTRRLIRRSPGVAAGMLVGVAKYVGRPEDADAQSVEKAA